MLPVYTQPDYMKLKTPYGRAYYARVNGVPGSKSVRIRKPFKRAADALDYARKLAERYERLKAVQKVEVKDAETASS